MKEQSGFTLVEMLTVIALIALFSTLAVIHFPSARMLDVDKLADQLAMDMHQAARHSIFSGKAVAWDAKTGTFSSYQQGKWKVVSGLGAKRKTAQTEVQYTLEETESPYVVFSPTGESSPATIRIMLGEAVRLLTINAAGQIKQESQES